VPTEDVVKRIELGVRQAAAGSRHQKNKMLLIAFAAAAVIFFGSSFLFPSVSRVMAEMPLIGFLYKDLVGENLATQKLVTALNETASDKGIDLTLTSAYYDGAVIGVTFEAAGRVTKEPDGRAMGFYEIFNGDEKLGETKEIVYLDPSDKGFSGQIRLTYPKTALPADTALPLEFKEMGGKKGSWKFKVPITQLPYEKTALNLESGAEDFTIHFDTLVTGKASSAIEYTVTMPVENKNDQIRFHLMDENGNPIYETSDEKLEKKIDGEQQIIKGRTTILDDLQGKTRYLEVWPQAVLYEPDQFVQLKSQTPMHIKSDRQDLSVTIEKITLNDNTFSIDFQVNNGEEGKRHFTDFENFARNDVTLVKESRKEVYEQPTKHTVKTLDKQELRFRSVFDLRKVENFQPDQYLIRVSLNALALNMPLEIEPVRVDLD